MEKSRNTTSTEGRVDTKKHYYYMCTLECFHYCISYNFFLSPANIVKAELKSDLLLNNIKILRKYRDSLYRKLGYKLNMASSESMNSRQIILYKYRTTKIHFMFTHTRFSDVVWVHRNVNRLTFLGKDICYGKNL